MRHAQLCIRVLIAAIAVSALLSAIGKVAAPIAILWLSGPPKNGPIVCSFCPMRPEQEAEMKREIANTILAEATSMQDPREANKSRETAGKMLREAEAIEALLKPKRAQLKQLR